MHKASSEVSTKSPNFVRKTFNALLGRKNPRRSISAEELYDPGDFARERGTSVKCRKICLRLRSSFFDMLEHSLRNLKKNFFQLWFGHVSTLAKASLSSLLLRLSTP
jgi:hypothetical protein